MTLALVALPFIAAVASMILGQDLNWDLQNYHLYNPYAFLNERLGQDLMPAGQQSYFNPFLDVIFFVSYASLGPLLTGALLGFLQGLNLALVVLIARRLLELENLGGRNSAIALAVLGGCSAGFISELGTTFHDSTLSVLSAASVYVVIRDNEAGWRRCVIAGLLLGVACGVKPTFVIYALSLCLALLVAGKRFKQQFRQSFAFGVGTLGGVLIASGYWYFHIWQLTGNPLFPQVNQIFGGELALPYAVRDPRFLPRSMLQALFYPLYFTLDPLLVGEIEYRQLSWVVLFLLVVLVAGRQLMGLFRAGASSRAVSFHPATRLLFFYFAFAYLLWLVLFGIYRYLVPLEYFIPLIVFVVIKKYFAYVKSAVLYAGLVLMALYNLQGAPSWGRAGWSDELYSFEAPTDLSAVSTILLLGQPLAWLVPLFPPAIPFIQIVPNFSVSARYWEEAAERADRSGGLRLIYDRGTFSDESARNRVENLGYPLRLTSCDTLPAYLGSREYRYAYCEVVLERP
jgi:hypothetical protein